MTDRIHECYICLEEGGTIESPCACTAHAHAKCLARWVAEQKTTTCPVCRRDYRAYVEQRLADMGLGASAPVIDDDDVDEDETVVNEDQDEDSIPEINVDLRRQRRRLVDPRPSAPTAASVGETDPTYPVVEPFRPPRQHIPSRSASPQRPSTQSAQSPPPPPPRRRRWKERIRRFFGMDDDRPRSIVRAVVVVVVIAVCFIGFVVLL